MRMGSRAGGALRAAIGFLLLFCLLASCGEAITYIDWQKCLGGSEIDEAFSIQQTADGGYIVAGATASDDGDVDGFHHDPNISRLCHDFWVLRLTPSGNLLWQKCLGGYMEETARCIRQTADGGYVVAGYTSSSDRDVSGNHGGYDYWVVKLNPFGKLVWQKCLGGSSYDWAESLEQTADGGYIVAGYTLSNDEDVSGNHGLRDYWIVKLGWSGEIKWKKCLGGNQDDYAHSIQQTADGGYVVAGLTASNNDDVSGNHGGGDLWIVKLNESGDLVWQRCLGGKQGDYAHSIQQTADGGYVVAGLTASNNGDVSGNHGDWDYWVVKLNESGNLTWQKCLGGSKADLTQSIQQTADGGYIVAGFTYSNNGDVSGNHGDWDYWVVKLNESGNLVWQKCLGGSRNDLAYSVLQTADGNYVVAGRTDSDNGNVRGNHGGNDYWVVKLGEINCTITAPDVVCSGSTGNVASTAESNAAYSWTITNGTITSAKNTKSIEFTAGSSGPIRLAVRVTKKDSREECHKDITVKTTDCSWTSNAPVCDGKPVQFTGPSGMDDYKWDFGDRSIGPIDRAQNPSHLYLDSGIYTVTLTVTSKCGGSEKCHGRIEVKRMPDCRWSSNAPVCYGTPVQFTGPTGMDSYQWDFGDGQIDSTEDPAHLYSAPGTYIVSLTAAKGGCSKSCSRSVEVKWPDCSWTASAPVCYGTPVQFTGTSGMDSYQWDFGDGQVGSAQGVSHLYSAPGTYTVNLTATKGGCTKICTGTVEVKGPDCRWTSNAPVCYGTPIQFSGPSGMDAYYWEFGDGQVSSAQNVSHLYSAPGSYTVNLTAAKGGCSKSCGGSVVVKGPDCRWTASAPVCIGTPVQFNGPAGMDSYFWELGDGAVSSAQGVSHLYSALGTYLVSLWATKGGCTKGCTKTVEVKSQPDCTITAPDSICAGSTGNATSTAASGATYAWSITNGEITSPSDRQSITFTAGSSGTIKLKVTVTTAGGCSKECTKDITVTTGPDCTISAPDSVCAGSTGNAVSTAASGAAYVWSITNGEITSASNGQSITFTAGASGTTTLKVKVTTADGCSKECSKEISILSRPDCSWTSNAPVCNGTPVQFTGPAGMDSSRWDFGDGAVSSAQSASHLYSSPGNYTVSLNATKDSCSKTCTGSVEVKPMPDCSWTSSSPVCDGTAIVFDGPSGMDAYQWDFGDGQVGSAQDASHLYSAPGNYTVSLNATKDSCSKTCPGSVVVRSQTDCSLPSNTPAPNGTAAQLSVPMGTDSSRGELGDGQAGPPEDRVRIYPG
jgi:PKD repeat protein